MDKTIKRKWVKALRSGKYKQGKSKLRKGKSGDYSFCCLGVLCDVMKVTFRPSAEYPPHKVTNSVGLERGSFLKQGPNVKGLAYQNDTGRSFAEIADYIERYL